MLKVESMSYSYYIVPCGFPTSLLLMTQLQHLSLACCCPTTLCSFGSLPDGFGDLSDLESLLLWNCNVTALPASTARLSKLTSLHVLAARHFIQPEVQLALPGSPRTALQELQLSAYALPETEWAMSSLTSLVWDQCTGLAAHLQRLAAHLKRLQELQLTNYLGTSLEAALDAATLPPG